MSNPRPDDLTAVRQQALDAEHAEEKAARAAELAMATAAGERARGQDEIVDYYKTASVALPEPWKSPEDALPYRDVTIKIGIDQMCFGREVNTETYVDEAGEEHEVLVPGAIRYYDFHEGQQYRLPRALAQHLQNKGYLL